MSIAPHLSQHSIVTFDPATGIVYVAYHQTFTSEMLVEVYHWFTDIIEKQAASISGLIVDFRQVEQFEINPFTAQGISRSLVEKYHATEFATAMIVANPQQERAVTSALGIVPRDLCFRFVKSEKDALHFIYEWHAQDAHSALSLG
jgi:hypothetical protein